MGILSILVQHELKKDLIDHTFKQIKELRKGANSFGDRPTKYKEEEYTWK